VGITLGKGFAALTQNISSSMVGVHFGGSSMRLFARVSPLCLLLLVGCASARNPWVELNGKQYTVEIANTDATRERGLMFRQAMDPGHGMLFIHDRQEPLAYWMKNTLIPLDILFFDNQHRLVSQQRDVPPCTLGDACPPYPSDAPARYVLELNAGQAARIRLQNGAELRLDPRIVPAQ
jgi:uncharacterized membrane protein (UPF0127 family)